MAREFENKVTSAIHAIFSAFKAVSPDDVPFYWYDKTFEWGNFKITGMQDEEVDLNENFVWKDLVVEWYKYWPRGIEMNVNPNDVEDQFYEDVGEFVKWILTEYDPKKGLTQDKQ